MHGNRPPDKKLAATGKGALPIAQPYYHAQDKAKATKPHEKTHIANKASK